MASINSSLVGLPALLSRALKGTFGSLTGTQTFSGDNIFSGSLTGTGTTQLNTIKVGTSGTVGAFNVYPTTASKGSIRILAADSAGDTVTTITNASQAGARTYTIPDAGASASFVMTEGTQTINGTKTISGSNTHSGANTFSGANSFSNTNTFTSTVKLGQSGTSGLAELYPTTAAKGKTTFTTSDNSGDTVTNLNVAAQTGARTYTVPDAGASASVVMSEGAQTINGVKTFGSVPIGTAYIVSTSLTTITGLAGAAKVIIVAPFAGTITDGRAAIDGAITVSDITLQLRINTTSVTNGSMTVANAGSGFGTKASCTPSAANTFVVGDVLNVTLTGGVGTVGGAVSISITRTS